MKSQHLQQFMDFLTFGGTAPDGTTCSGYSRSYLHAFSAVLNQSFRFAVFPKNLITFNPMQYVVIHKRNEQADIFGTEQEEDMTAETITHEQFLELVCFLEEKQHPALLPVQIAYYAGLRIGEACSLTWGDINLDEQHLTVRRSVSRNEGRRVMEIGPTKRNKIRVVDFGDTLTAILKKARKEQLKRRLEYGELSHRNFAKKVLDKNRVHYELHTLAITEDVPEDFQELDFVCTRADGCYTSPVQVSATCRTAAKKIEGLEGFHFHCLRHTYTSNLLANGAAPKDVQELLGHSDVSTTMNVYAHATREAKRASARLLDQVAGMD